MASSSGLIIVETRQVFDSRRSGHGGDYKAQARNVKGIDGDEVL
jgi:hypothetical protein